MIRVVIYSDQPILARGLEELIAADPEMKLAAYCATITGLHEHLAHADLAVLDLTPKITTGMLQDLQNGAPGCKLILWTTSIAGDFALHALTIGIGGVLRKTLSLEAHRQCLHRVHAGDLWFEKSLTDNFRSARRVSLTLRESQLVGMLSRGLKNKEISTELGITEGTVKVYLSHLFQKAGTKDRFELAMQGLKNMNLAGIQTDGRQGLRTLLMEPACR